LADVTLGASKDELKNRPLLRLATERVPEPVAQLSPFV
jgi:hypothetical protein